MTGSRRADRRDRSSRAVLLGAALFGLWHLVVGGLINGNPRAGTFGLLLALAAGVPLIVGTWARPPASPARRRGLSAAARLDGWSERESAVLVALAETFVAGDAEPRAALAGQALAQTADPDQLAHIRLVLRAMDSGAANLALAGRPTGFTAMTPEARERYLLGWAGSRIPQRRSAFAAFRKLLTFLAYAPGGDGLADPHLAALGFRPDDPPVATERSAVRVMALPRSAHGVGGRPGHARGRRGRRRFGGGRRGRRRGIGPSRALGRGPRGGPFSDEAAMPRAELDGFDRHYLNHGLTTTWDGSVTMLAGTGVGGGTLVNWMTCIAAPEDVRVEWETRPRARRDDRRRVGERRRSHRIRTRRRRVHAHPAEGRDPPARRPGARLGGRPDATQRRRLRRLRELRVRLPARDQAVGHPGRILREASTPRSACHRGRDASRGCCWRAAGRVGRGGASSAGADPTAGRARSSSRAPIVVLAAGALRTPAILQATGLEHPRIGRHLRLHPVPVVAGMFDELVEMWRGTLQAARSLEFSGLDAGRNGYVIESAPGHPGPPRARPAVGGRRRARRRHAADRPPVAADRRDPGWRRGSGRG